MAILGWVGLGVLSWLLFGLMLIRLASRRGHLWGYHSMRPLLGRAAIVFQAPALILECKVMDWCEPTTDRLARAAALLMWAKLVDPKVDIDCLAEKISERRSG